MTPPLLKICFRKSGSKYCADLSNQARRFRDFRESEDTNILQIDRFELLGKFRIFLAIYERIQNWKGTEVYIEECRMERYMELYREVIKPYMIWANDMEDFLADTIYEPNYSDVMTLMFIKEHLNTSGSNEMIYADVPVNYGDTRCHDLSRQVILYCR